jgi:hypothetical protein
MPFDGVLPSNIKSVILHNCDPSIQSSRTRPRKRMRFGQIFFLLALLYAAVFSELIFPGYGVFTRLLMGNDYANQNMLGYDIFRHGDVLSFEIGDHHYQVVSPSHPLDATQTAAWIAFTGRQHWPLYSVDGPLAYDP